MTGTGLLVWELYTKVTSSHFACPFTDQWGAQRQRPSPCSCLNPGGQYVAGRVQVRILGMTTSHALEHRLRCSIFLADMTASAARLRSIGRVDPDDLRLVFQFLLQTMPARFPDFTIQSRLGFYVLARIVHRSLCRFGHALRVQVFQYNQTRLVRNLTAHLMLPVVSGIFQMPAAFLQFQAGLVPASRTLDLPLHPALVSFQAGFLFRQIGQVVDGFIAVAVHYCNLSSISINPGGCLILVFLNFNFMANNGIPLARFLGDDCFYWLSSWIRISTFALNSQPTDLLDVQFAVLYLDVFRNRERRIITVSGLELRKALA